ncbi:MAG TPA: RNA polymerase sigma factor [Pilimelia sp.]|nr:RNA polymerase sigma factor [Pilimelia sp.]
METALAADRIGAAGQVGEATDAQIIRASRQSPDRFGTLYDRYATVLYGYACLRVGRVQAEDVVADTFLAAFAQRHRYDLARASARPWLFGILTNKIAERRRAETTHYRAYARAWQSPVLEGIADRVADQVTAQARRGQLSAALSRLNPADRHVLLLVAWAQLSYDEVAQALGIPPGTVASRLNRARRKVRAALDNENG